MEAARGLRQDEGPQSRPFFMGARVTRAATAPTCAMAASCGRPGPRRCRPSPRTSRRAPGRRWRCRCPALSRRVAACGRTAARWCRARPLQTQGGAYASGLLVAFRTVPAQSGGDWVKGTWLTNERRFWEFEAVVPRQEGESVEIERLEDMTDSVEVSAYVPGTARLLAIWRSRSGTLS